MAWSMGTVAPMPIHTANTVPMKNTIMATGRRKGFWNLLIDSMKGTVMRPAGTAAMESTPSSLLGITRSMLNVGKKYLNTKWERSRQCAIHGLM
jgi:hypothetical protein